MVAAIARTTFGTSFRERADALSYFELYLWKATRPTEMLSVAQAVLRYRPAADDALYLESVMQWVFEHGESEPRGFAAMGPALVSKIGDVDASHRKLGVRNATVMPRNAVGNRGTVTATRSTFRSIDSAKA